MHVKRSRLHEEALVAREKRETRLEVSTLTEFRYFYHWNFHFPDTGPGLQVRTIAINIHTASTAKEKLEGKGTWLCLKKSLPRCQQRTNSNHPSHPSANEKKNYEKNFQKIEEAPQLPYYRSLYEWNVLLKIQSNIKFNLT